MKNYKFFLLFIIAVFLIISCESKPGTVQTPIPQGPIVQAPPIATTPPVTTVTPPVTTPPVTTTPPANTNENNTGNFTVSQAYYESTREEVHRFIENLNTIIRNRNYNGWRAVLSDQYFAEISSEENLRQVSEQPAMRIRNITLRTPQDYFTHVVVPSRANLRLDEIRFDNMNRVRAYDERGMLLYYLERIGDTWTVIGQ